jgi:hypothetical protein
MMILIQANLLPIAAALLIGIATARWTFRRPSSGPKSK